MISPLSSLENLLSKNQQITQENYINDSIENLGHVFDVDYKEGIITYWSDFSQNEVKYSFRTYFESKINFEAIQAYLSFKKSVFSISADGKTPDFYIESVIKSLENLIAQTKEFFLSYPQIIQVLENLNHRIKTTFPLDITKKVKTNYHCAENIFSHNASENSFTWNEYHEEEANVNQIKKIFKLLTQSPAIIIAEETDFVNAFTGRKVTNGIWWLLQGKNSLTNTCTICYLIRKLEIENYIEEFESKNFAKKLVYVFRKNDGSQFKLTSMTQSVSDFRKTELCADSERFDEILLNI